MVLEVYVTEIGGSMQTLRFAKSPVRIGRNQLNDIPLEDPFVSEWHGAIRFDDSSIAYSDMGSTNGSVLDGKRLAKNVSAPISDLSRLVLGRRELMFARVAGEASEPVRAPPPGGFSAPAPTMFAGAAPEPENPWRSSEPSPSPSPSPSPDPWRASEPGPGPSKTIGWGEPIPALKAGASTPGIASPGPDAAGGQTRIGMRDEAKVIVQMTPIPAATSAPSGPARVERSHVEPARSPQPSVSGSLHGVAATSAPAVSRSYAGVAATSAPAASGSFSGVAPIPSQARGVDDATLERQRRLLEAFAEAFVGLRKGYEQFGSEVGVRTVNGSTPLHRARSSSEVLAHMLSPKVDAAAVARDMKGIFADFGIHHIAMMEGITQGVRSVLQTLDPRANNLEAGGGLFSGGKHKARWNEYLERFDQLITDDEQLHIAIFGEEFAHAYASVTLGGGNKPPKGE
jgi:type VI secretion system protein ImpI